MKQAGDARLAMGTNLLLCFTKPATPRPAPLRMPLQCGTDRKLTQDVVESLIFRGRSPAKENTSRIPLGKFGALSSWEIFERPRFRAP